MLTNSDMTLYAFDKSTGYTRMYFQEVFWQYSKRKNVLKMGSQSADSLFIGIPYDASQSLNLTCTKCLAVKGKELFEFDNTDEKSRSESLKKLREKTDLHEVTTFEPKLYGSEEMWHYELSCK